MVGNDGLEESYAELEPEVEDAVDQPDARPVSSQPHDWTISTLRDKYDRGHIDLQPHYQREYVWELKPELPSRLIESLLLQIPIPPLYFVRLSGTGKIEVVDGQQRLTTLIRFVKNEFPLQKLERLSSLNGKFLRELSEVDQEKIFDASIRSIVIDSGTNQDLRYEVFERLNRGAMALKEQEIRNCVYRGLFCNLLAELEQDANWRSVKGTPVPEPRFIEREMILRFFAFSSRMDFYKGNLKKFLNEYMDKYAPKEKLQVEELGSLFRQTMQNVNAAFGEYSGRLYTVDEGVSQDEGRWEKKFSISALDLQASALIGYPPVQVRALAKSIQEAYKFYLVTNPQIREAISYRPSGTKATKTRWFGFKTVVQELFSTSTDAGVSSDSLFAAKALFRAGYFPAAGAVTGVELERHLKALVDSLNPTPTVRGKTISPLNDALKAAQVYDQIQHRRIQVLGDIRNQCSHATNELPTKENVWKLIEEVGTFLNQYPIKK